MTEANPGRTVISLTHRSTLSRLRKCADCGEEVDEDLKPQRSRRERGAMGPEQELNQVEPEEVGQVGPEVEVDQVQPNTEVDQMESEIEVDQVESGDIKAMTIENQVCVVLNLHTSVQEGRPRVEKRQDVRYTLAEFFHKAGSMTWFYIKHAFNSIKFNRLLSTHRLKKPAALAAMANAPEDLRRSVNEGGLCESRIESQ
jgi:hypothetical protein